MADLKEIVAAMTRAELLLVKATLDYETDSSTFSGHNTQWAEDVDLVLEGRRGLFDYSDDELRTELEQNLEEGWAELALESKEALISWAQDQSGIGWIDPDKKAWGAVAEEE